MDSDTIEDNAEPSNPTHVSDLTEEPGEENSSSDPSDQPQVDSSEENSSPDEPESFPREVVEKLRQENGRYRQRAQQADTLARRLHTELVRATGRLADPTDLEFDESHLDDPDALASAIGDLLDRKPHLASRRPVGDVGQGNRGSSAAPFSLLGLLKERT